MGHAKIEETEPTEPMAAALRDALDAYLVPRPRQHSVDLETGGVPPEKISISVVPFRADGSVILRGGRGGLTCLHGELRTGESIRDGVHGILETAGVDRRAAAGWTSRRYAFCWGEKQKHCVVLGRAGDGWRLRGAAAVSPPDLFGVLRSGRVDPASVTPLVVATSFHWYARAGAAHPPDPLRSALLAWDRSHAES